MVVCTLIGRVQVPLDAAAKRPHGNVELKGSLHSHQEPENNLSDHYCKNFLAVLYRSERWQ